MRELTLLASGFNHYFHETFCSLLVEGNTANNDKNQHLIRNSVTRSVNNSSDRIHAT